MWMAESNKDLDERQYYSEVDICTPVFPMNTSVVSGWASTICKEDSQFRGPSEIMAPTLTASGGHN